MAKLFEKLPLKKWKPITEEKELISNQQFGIRNTHSTIDQNNRITNIIKKITKKEKI